jgi:hypothetical protein
MLKRYFVVLNVFVVLFFHSFLNQIQYNKYTFLDQISIYTTILILPYLIYRLNCLIVQIKNLSSKVIVTSFVALEDFENTTQLSKAFGRKYVERTS